MGLYSSAIGLMSRAFPLCTRTASIAQHLRPSLLELSAKERMARNSMQGRLLHQVSYPSYSFFSHSKLTVKFKSDFFVETKQEVFQLEERFMAGTWFPPFELPALSDTSNKAKPPAKKQRQGKEGHSQLIIICIRVRNTILVERDRAAP